MSGDWIKMRTDLRRSPQVVRIASALKADRLRIIGALHAVWCLADEQTEDGTLDAYSFSLIDEEIGWQGFCQAMADVGWIEQNEKGVCFPEFTKHNGASAKRRAQEADRKRESRASALPSASDADKKRTREEERREDKDTESAGFDAFWQLYPNKKSKGAAEKAWAKIKPDEQLQAQIFEGVRRAKTSVDWQKDGGRYIQHPATWLNAKGWLDDTEPGLFSGQVEGAAI